ncbi:MAG: CAP domain-containing protein [Verrucomicrobiales bacterium]
MITILRLSLLPVLLYVFAAVIATPALHGQSQEKREGDYRMVEADLPKASGDGADIAETEAAIFRDANRFRKQNDLEPLERNDELDAAARDFAGYMAETHRYGHTADDRQPSERASAADYAFCFVAENIAYQYRSESIAASSLSNHFLTGWKESPGHRENLLAVPPTETGVGVARSEKTGAYFAVQLFGRPESEKVRFRVINDSGEEVRYFLRAEGSSEEGREHELPPRAVGIHEQCSPTRLRLSDASAEEAVEVDDGAKVRIFGNGKGLGVEVDPGSR